MAFAIGGGWLTEGARSKLPVHTEGGGLVVPSVLIDRFDVVFLLAHDRRIGRIADLEEQCQTFNRASV